MTSVTGSTNGHGAGMPAEDSSIAKRTLSCKVKATGHTAPISEASHLKKKQRLELKLDTTIASLSGRVDFHATVNSNVAHSSHLGNSVPSSEHSITSDSRASSGHSSIQLSAPAQRDQNSSTMEHPEASVKERFPFSVVATFRASRSRSAISRGLQAPDLQSHQQCWSSRTAHSITSFSQRPFLPQAIAVKPFRFPLSVLSMDLVIYPPKQRPESEG